MSRTLTFALVLCLAYANGQRNVSITGVGSEVTEPLAKALIAQTAASQPQLSVSFNTTPTGDESKKLFQAGNKYDFLLTASAIEPGFNGLNFTSRQLIQVPIGFRDTGIAYNIPGLPSNLSLRLDENLLSDIYQCNVVSWSDPAVLALNPAIRADTNATIRPYTYTTDTAVTATLLGYLAQATGWLQGRQYNPPSCVLKVESQDDLLRIIGNTSNALGFAAYRGMMRKGARSALLKNRAGKLVGPSMNRTLDNSTAIPQIIDGDWDQGNFSSNSAPSSYPLTSYVVLTGQQDFSKQGSPAYEGLHAFLESALSDQSQSALKGLINPLSNAAPFMVTSIRAQLADLRNPGSAGDQGGSGAANGSSSMGEGTTLVGIGSQATNDLMPQMVANATLAGILQHTNVTYSPTSTQLGLDKMVQGKIDFAVAGVPVGPIQYNSSKNTLLNVPFAISPFAIYHTLPGIPSGALKLDSEILAKIYTCTITSWSDKAIAALNPDLTLPPLNITVLGRDEAADSTYFLSEYMSKDAAWTQGVSNKQTWARCVKRINTLNGIRNAINNGSAGTLGYGTYAARSTSNGIQRAALTSLQNAAGQYIVPSLNLFTRFKGTAPPTLATSDWTGDVYTQGGKQGADDVYPITGTIFFVVDQNAGATLGEAKATTLKKMLQYALSDSVQAALPFYSFLPMPSNELLRIRKLLAQEMTTDPRLPARAGNRSGNATGDSIPVGPSPSNKNVVVPAAAASAGVLILLAILAALALAFCQSRKKQQAKQKEQQQQQQQQVMKKGQEVYPVSSSEKNITSWWRSVKGKDMSSQDEESEGGVERLKRGQPQPSGPSCHQCSHPHSHPHPSGRPSGSPHSSAAASEASFTTANTGNMSKLHRMRDTLRARALKEMGDIQRGGLIGKGSFGSVYKCRWRGGTIALKIISHDNGLDGSEVALRESLLCANIKHPNVVTTFQAHVVPLTPPSVEAITPQAQAGPPSKPPAYPSRAAAPAVDPLGAAAPAADGLAADPPGAAAPPPAPPSRLSASTGTTGDAAPKGPSKRSKTGRDKEERQAITGSGRRRSVSLETRPVQTETWLCLEYCDEGNLDEANLDGKLKGDFGLVCLCLLDIAAGMDYLHSLGVLHLDLKTANILLKACLATRYDPRGFVCKLTDLGLSRLLDTDTVTHIKTEHYGTIQYMPPEAIHNKVVSKATDIYSFGSIMAELCSGKRLYHGMNDLRMMHAIHTGQKPKVDTSHFPPGYAEIMWRCWSDDEEERPSFFEITQELRTIYAENEPAPEPPAARSNPDYCSDTDSVSSADRPREYKTDEYRLDAPLPVNLLVKDPEASIGDQQPEEKLEKKHINRLLRARSAAHRPGGPTSLRPSRWTTAAGRVMAANAFKQGPPANKDGQNAGAGKPSLQRLSQDPSGSQRAGPVDTPQEGGGLAMGTIARQRSQSLHAAITHDWRSSVAASSTPLGLPPLTENPSGEANDEAYAREAADRSAASLKRRHTAQQPLKIDPSEIPHAPAGDASGDVWGQALGELRRSNVTPLVIDPSEIPKAPAEDDEAWGEGLGLGELRRSNVTPLVIDPSEIPKAPAEDDEAWGQGLGLGDLRSSNVTPLVIDPSEIPKAPAENDEAWGQGLAELPRRNPRREDREPQS